MEKKNKNNYLKVEDFLCLYNLLSDKDIVSEVKEDIKDIKRQIAKRKEIGKRINELETNYNRYTPTERDAIYSQLRKLKLMEQSYCIDEASIENRKDMLNSKLEKLVMLLEDVIYQLISLEEM